MREVVDKRKHRFRCSVCGNRVKSKDGICESCKKNFNKFHTLPKPSSAKGVQEYDWVGRPICKICGRVQESLTRHLQHTHNMELFEYINMFELDPLTKVFQKSIKK